MAKRQQAASVTLVSYPKFFFVWPAIVAPGLCEVLLQANFSTELVGWTYLVSMALVLMALGIDMDRATTVFVVLTAISLVLLSRVVAYEYGQSLFSHATNLLDSLNVIYDRGTAAALSIILGLLYVWMFFWTRVHHRWKISQQEIRHYSGWVADRSLARGAKTIRTSYPDFLELMLGLSGTLHVFDASGEKELISIENVPFLPIVEKKIERVLQGEKPPSSSVVEDDEEKKQAA